MRILIVEDEAEMAALLARRLDRAGYPCDRTGTIAEAIEALRLFPYALTLLDRRLPDGDGADHVAAIHKLRPDMPVIMVSALDAYRDRVAGLDAGADDYVTKPFNGPEFLARVRARLRQSTGERELPPIVVGAISLDQRDRHVTIDGRAFPLHKRELALLSALMRRANRVATRSDLIAGIYGLDRAVSDGALDTLVSRLRKRLAEVDGRVEIHLVRGRGYLLTETAA